MSQTDLTVFMHMIYFHKQDHEMILLFREGFVGTFTPSQAPVVR
jgi:hypothetical protein